MKNLAKRSLAMLMALVMCVSLLSGIAVTASAASYIYNWGERGEIATSLSDNAIAFYEKKSTTYEELAALSGSSSTSGVPSSALYKELQSLMANAQTYTTKHTAIQRAYQRLSL